MKKLKKTLLLLSATVLLGGVSPYIPETGMHIVAEAHSGRTDGNGGHRDNKNKSGLGSYHYHCGGHPAHLHTNGTCPYAATASSSTKSIPAATETASVPTQTASAETAAPEPEFVPGWECDNTGWRYRYSEDSCKRNEFFRVGSDWYYADSTGYIVTSWQLIDDTQYCFDSDGHMVTGWQYYDGQWYYFDASGHKAAGWQSIDGCWYYFDEQGQMETGLCHIGGSVYYFDENGRWDGAVYGSAEDFWSQRND